MRCASCNVVLDPARLAGGQVRCECGVDLDLPGAPPPPMDEPPPPRAPELWSYRASPPPEPSRVPVVELAHVGAELSCPRCREPLLYAFQGSYDVHECTRCLGAFVDKAALETFVVEARTTASANVPLERLAGPTPGVRIDGVAPCPSCGTTMTRRVFGRRSGVLVDVCAEHGTWFDAGELSKVLAFEAGGGAKRVAEQEQQEARQDPVVAREKARAEAALLQANVREARAIGRLHVVFEGRRDLLDWLFGMK